MAISGGDEQGARSQIVKTRRNKLDVLFSKLIRERDDWTCQDRGIVCRDHSVLMDCAHIFSRRHVATRWHPQNAVTLTRGSHMRFTSDPFLWVDWCNKRFGEELIDELRVAAYQSVRWTKPLREEIYQHYKGELKRIEGLRAEGVTGRIEIEPHECMHVFGDSNE